MATRPRIGTTSACIDRAEQELSVALPGPLRQAMMAANRLEFECEGEGEFWEVHPVWDPENPRRTASHIVHENKPEQRWPGMPDEMLVIARHISTADRLVLEVVGRKAGEDVLVLDTADNSVRPSGRTVHEVWDQATAYARKVESASRRGK